MFDVSVIPGGYGKYSGYGNHYTLEKKAGETKPLEHIRLEKDEFWVLANFFGDSGREWQDGVVGTPDELNFYGLRAVIQYLKKFPEDHEEFKKAIDYKYYKIDYVVVEGSCRCKDPEALEKRKQLRAEILRIVNGGTSDVDKS